MERLTERREDGTATGIKRSIGDFVGIPEMLMRLAEYEDTGMTPQEVAALEARLQEAQTENKRITQLLVKEIHFDKDDLNIKLGGEGAMMFINYLVDLFKMNGGDNFLTCGVEGDGHRYAITIQNCDRELTPAQKMEQLEAELARLQVALEATIAEKEKYKRALKIACEVNSDMFATSEEAMIYCIRQAKEASK